MNEIIKYSPPIEEVEAQIFYLVGEFGRGATGLRKYVWDGLMALREYDSLKDWAEHHSDRVWPVKEGRFANKLVYLETNDVFRGVQCGPARNYYINNELGSLGMTMKVSATGPDVDGYHLEYWVDKSGGSWVRIRCPQCGQNIVWVNRPPRRFSIARLKAMWHLWRKKRE